MTSRERVLAAVNFEEVDRVPIDLGGMKASGITVKAYNQVKERLGIQTATRIWDPKFMIASVEEEVRRRLHLDVVSIDTSSVLDDESPDSAWSEATFYEGAGGQVPPSYHIGTDPEGRWMLLDPQGGPTPYRMPRQGYYFDDISFDPPGRTIDPAAFAPVAGFSDELLRAMENRAKRLYEQTDYALLGWGGGVCFLGLSLITDRRSNITMGMPSEWMVMLMTQKDTCHEMMDRAVDASIRSMQQLHDAVGDRCFAWGIASDDSGTQRGEFIRPQLWAEMIKPHYARLCRWIHENTQWKTFLHCCGSIYHLIPHMIEAGVDILNPVQTSAANMQPERLKAEFGSPLNSTGKIVFWGGGCDTQRVLGDHSPDEVREHVRERLAIFKPGGGYVFNQVHNVQTNVPAENILAMLEAAYECG
jgi:uroporphyrinogen decarboxylase